MPRRSLTENIIRTDPYARQHEMQPTLDAEAVERIKGYGVVRHVLSGEVLFNIGDEKINFIVVLTGALAIEVDLCDRTEIIVEHRSGAFSGEIDMFSNRRAVVRGRCLEAGEMLFLERSQFRKMLASNADLSELITRAFILRRTGLIFRETGGLVLIGREQEAHYVRLRSFLSRNGHPHRALNLEQDAVLTHEVMSHHNLTEEDLPAVVHHNDLVLRRPSARDVADQLGLSIPSGDEEVYDVAVVGVGPGGLAAAVNAAAEGLTVLAVEGHAPGGQAGTSSKIENYPGFPTGISGQALGGRMMLQAQKFGAEIVNPRTVKALNCESTPYSLLLEDGESIRARAVVIASGANWKRLALDNEETFENAGVFYGATAVEATLCEGQEVVVVGGGNSAGQAAVFLSDRARHVNMLIRGEGLRSSMSDYLIRRLESSSRITLHPWTEVAELRGESHLESLSWRNKKSGDLVEKQIRHVFVMIGAVPNTEWLDGCLMLDERGFIRTGADLPTEHLVGQEWEAHRMPFICEASRPGIFAVGDVRSGSVKRVASAVGEGAIASQFLYKVIHG